MDEIETNRLREDGTDGGNNDLKLNNIRKNDTGFLLLIVITGSMTCLYNGMSFMWTSSAIPKLKSNLTEENPIGRPITTFETSMLAGLPTLATLLGTILMGYASEIVGRKGSIQIAIVGIFISILAISFSTNIICIITFRCVFFFFSIGGSNVFLMYVIEICEDHNRSKYGCLAAGLSPFGQIIGYSLGALFNFKYFNLVGLSPMLVLLFFFFFAPESPVYNLSKNKIEICMRDLRRLRHNKNVKELDIDVRNIEYTIQKSKQSKEKMLVTKLVSTKESRYSLMLASSLVIFQMFCGFGIIVPFMEPIFIAAGTTFNSRYMPIIVASFKCVFCFLTSFVVEKCGKRLLFIISSAGAGAPLLALGCFFHLKYINSPLIYQFQWLPLVYMVSYIIFFTIGISVLPPATIGEFFTPDVRSTGISFASIVFAISLFCSSGTYPYIVEYMGMQWCLWIYGFLSFLSASIIYLIIPETVGKSIDEIQAYIKARCNNI